MGKALPRSRAQEHELAVYAAILGQRPALEPLDPGGDQYPPQRTSTSWLSNGVRWLRLRDVQKMVHDISLSPQFRARVEPLLSQLQMYCDQTMARLRRVNYEGTKTRKEEGS